MSRHPLKITNWLTLETPRLPDVLMAVGPCSPLGPGPLPRSFKEDSPWLRLAVARFLAGRVLVYCSVGDVSAAILRVDRDSDRVIAEVSLELYILAAPYAEGGRYHAPGQDRPLDMDVERDPILYGLNFKGAATGLAESFDRACMAAAVSVRAFGKSAAMREVMAEAINTARLSSRREAPKVVKPRSFSQEWVPSPILEMIRSAAIISEKGLAIDGLLLAHDMIPRPRRGLWSAPPRVSLLSMALSQLYPRP